MPPFPGFCGPAYESQSRNVAAQVCRNWYPEKVELASGKADWALLPTPGLSLFCESTNPDGTTHGPVRGFKWINGRLFAVAGVNLIEIEQDATILARGVLFGSDDKPVTIASSATQLAIASNGTLFSFDLSINNLDTPAGIANVERIGYSDGYFIALLRNTPQIQISALLEAKSWDALDTTRVSEFPDNLTSMLIDHREVWLFGDTRSIVYYNSGNPDFPFEPVPGALIEMGICAKDSVARLMSGPAWLGSDDRGGAVAWMARGYIPERISTHALEYIWSTYSRRDDAVGLVYQDKGHMFWRLTFPTAKATWVYDATTGLWHQVDYWETVHAESQAHRGWCHVYAFGKHLVGDRVNGKIYVLSSDYHDDAGDEIHRVRRTPYTINELNRVFFHRLQVDVEPGLGLVAGQGSDPKMMLRWSNDGAKTWQPYIDGAAGGIGDYSKRVYWNRLGSGRNRVWEVSTTDPIPWRIAGAYLDFTLGMH